MNSQAPDMVYIACDLSSDHQTLSEYRRAYAASHPAAEPRLQRAMRGLHLRHAARRGTPRLTPRPA